MARTIEVVAALIWRSGRFLACQRPPHKARALLWEFPGGKIEPGESGPEALVRECREELDADIRVLGAFMDVTHAYPDLTVHLTLYESELASGGCTGSSTAISALSRRRRSTSTTSARRNQAFCGQGDSNG